MKYISSIVIAFLTFLLVAACGSEAADGDVVLEVVPAVSVVVPQGRGSSCPTTLTCPSSIAGYDTFMYAYHYTTQLQCWYRNSTTNAVSSTTIAIASTCSNCCAPGYCPDQRLNTITFAQTWSCTQ